MCANCGLTIGPFYRSIYEKGVKVLDLPPLCKNTKENPNRISQCVERRGKIDTERFKEQIHPYQ